jgi:hypothetical protein
MLVQAGLVLLLPSLDQVCSMQVAVVAVVTLVDNLAHTALLVQVVVTAAVNMQ